MSSNPGKPGNQGNPGNPGNPGNTNDSSGTAVSAERQCHARSKAVISRKNPA
jgi:hypothetical protein